MRPMVDWRDFLQLRDGEYVIDSRMNLWGELGSGTLALTNQRLVHLKSGGGFFRTKHYEVNKDIPLESIRGIDCKGILLQSTNFRMIVYTDEGKLDLTLVEVSSQSQSKSMGENFKERILRQMEQRRQEIESKKIPVVIDFSFVKTFVEKGGIALTTLRCPNCNAPIKMPKGGTETVCEHCRSNVYAQDIFEKVKKLTE